MQRKRRAGIVLALVLMMLLLLSACGQEEIPLPEDLSGRKLSDEELQALSPSDPQAMRASISTLEDAAAWFSLHNAIGSGSGGGDEYYDEYPGYRIIFPAAFLLENYNSSNQPLGESEVALITAWLLQDDYEGAGAVVDVSQSGGVKVLLCLPADGGYHLIHVPGLVPGHGRGVPLYQYSEDLIQKIKGMPDTGTGERAFVTDLTRGLGFRSAHGVCAFLNRDQLRLLRQLPETKLALLSDEGESSGFLHRISRDFIVKTYGSGASDSVLEQYGIRRLSEEERTSLTGGRNLSDEELAALGCEDTDALRAALSTPEDVAAWLRLQSFDYWDCAQIVNSMGAIQHYYPTPAFMLHPEGLGEAGDTYIGRDSINLLAAWLLQDDFDDCGALLVLMPENDYGFLPYSAVCIRLGGESCLFNMAAMIDMVTMSGSVEPVELLDGLAVKDLDRLAEYIDFCTADDTVQHGEIALLRDLEQPTRLELYGNNTHFLDRSVVLYAEQSGETALDYLLSHGAPGQEWALREFDIEDYDIPAALGDSRLSETELTALVGQDVDAVAEKVNTVPDLIRYLHAGGFTYGGGDIWEEDAEDSNLTWHFNKTAQTANLTRGIGCGATANLVRRLLDGDYPEVGYVLHTYRNGEGGGHVYNYIFDGSRYYVFDMTSVTGSHYAPEALRIVEMNDLAEYADRFREMNSPYGGYGDYLPVIYAYDAPDEIPLAWGNGEDGCSVTWYPTGTRLQVIYEDRAAGYRVDTRDLPAQTAEAIAQSRKDGVNSWGNFRSDTFPGVEAYGFPAAFGQATVSFDEMLSLVWTADMKTLAEKVKTVPDLMMYFYAAGYNGDEGEGGTDIHLDTGEDVIWHYNEYAERCRYLSSHACGQCAATVRYLLDGDYDEVGYISCTWAEGMGGGHNFNYFKIDGEYYALDMNLYDDCEYDPAARAFVKIGDDLPAFRDCYEQMYGGSMMMCCYASARLRETPVGWTGSSVKVSYLPEQYEKDIRILWTTEDEGYTYCFVPLDERVEAYMDLLRAG